MPAHSSVPLLLVTPHSCLSSCYCCHPATHSCFLKISCSIRLLCSVTVTRIPGSLCRDFHWCPSFSFFCCFAAYPSWSLPSASILLISCVALMSAVSCRFSSHLCCCSFALPAVLVLPFLSLCGFRSATFLLSTTILLVSCKSLSLASSSKFLATSAGRSLTACVVSASCVPWFTCLRRLLFRILTVCSYRCSLCRFLFRVPPYYFCRSLFLLCVLTVVSHCLPCRAFSLLLSACSSLCCARMLLL